MSDLTRRRLLCSTLAGAILIPNLASAAYPEIAQTTAGKVRGKWDSGVFSFKGIPYGAPTAGQHRFLPLSEPEEWTGIRDARVLGPISPQVTYDNPAILVKLDDAIREQLTNVRSMFEGVLVKREEHQSESCLVLNVWTPSLDSRKRPVMVWLHGGGFSLGSSNIPWYDGSNLARENDVVVVGLNHRLNVFGFLYLGAWSDKYADSGNAGMLDIQLALTWIKRNIEAFGGDPGNVTLFGQSGGGTKINTLMAMTEGRGLFHKAIVESGSSPFVSSVREATENTVEILQALRLTPNDIDELQDYPANRFIETVPMQLLNKLSPVIDGRSLKYSPLGAVATAASANIPLIIGTVRDDAQELTADVLTIDESKLRHRVITMLDGDENASGDIIAAYHTNHPNASPSELWTRISTDYTQRNYAILQAERRVLLGGTLVYMYLFTGRSAYKSGKFGTPHNSELPFVFDNLDKAPGLVGQNSDPMVLKLAKNMSSTWAAFARSGNPNHSGSVGWKAYVLPERATMCFQINSFLTNDPESADRRAMEPLVRKITKADV